MKWNCGPTSVERTIAKERWHVWFAWRPVRIGSHDCRWLEPVERKGECIQGYWFWAHRPLQVQHSGEQK